MRGIRNNIVYLAIIKYSKWFMLFMPLIIKFYTGLGFSMNQILILQSIYSVSMLSFEIPSGYSSDIFGRRITLIIGTVCGFFGFTMYIFADFFWHFAIAEIIMGVGMSFVSGADSAMLYDSLFDMKKQSQYSKFEGRVTAVGNYAEAIAGIFGGILAYSLVKHFPSYGLQSIFIFQAIIASTGIPASILLIEPKRHAPGKKEALKNILKISHFALFKSKELRYNILFSALIGSATLTMAWFVQKLFLSLGVTHETHLGYLWAALNAAVGTFTLFAYKVDKKLGNIKTMVLITLLISIGYITLIFNIGFYSLIIIFIFYFTRGIATPVLKDYINRITASEVRATILSLRSFIIRIIFSVMGPVIGWLSDIDLRKAMFYTGIFYLVLSIFLLRKIKKLSKIESNLNAA